MGSVKDLVASVKVFPEILQSLLYPVAISLGEQVGIYQHKPPTATVRRAGREVSFAGRWWAHGVTLDITRSGSGELVWNAGPCTSSLTETRMCSGVAAVNLTPGANGRMDGIYTKVWYVDWEGQPADGHGNADGDPKVGQRFWLAKNSADKSGHTLITGGSAENPYGPGNPYLCDNYAADHYAAIYQICGA